MARIKKSKIKNPRPRRAVIIAFILLFTVLCLLFSVYWFSGYGGRDPQNVVISSGENLSVLSLRPGEKRAVSIQIPPTAIVEVPGRGKWQARALWEISQLENDPSLAAAAGWNLLEVPIDLTLRLPLSLSSWRDMPLFWSLGRIQIKDIDLSSISVSRRVVDPGGAELIEINPDLLSPLVADWFGLDSLRREGLTIAVRNNSFRTGAGALLSRQLEHVGLRVVFVADGAGENTLTIKSGELKKSLTVGKLSSWLKVKPVVSDFPERADILIVVK
jgi:hypothetical protein